MVTGINPLEALYMGRQNRRAQMQADQLAAQRAQQMERSKYDFGRTQTKDARGDAAFNTKVFPVVTAKGIIQPIGIIPGKFHGAIPTNTPSGSR